MMLVTLAWKEFREHRAIWLMMVVMTCGLGMGLAEIVAPGDPVMALAVASLSILGMAGAYGVVCGAMMLAGEHESGTLVFLDIFLGRRHLLWLGKWCIGLGLAATEALAVGGVLCFFKQMPPSWAPALIGLGSSAVPMPAAGHADWGPVLWLVVLPVITVEAFAWGLFGSALTRRVLSAAAVAALVATPVWLFAVVMPAPAFLVIRLAAAFIVLCVSYAVFFAQARETSLVLAPSPRRPPTHAAASWSCGRNTNSRIAPNAAQPSTMSIPSAKKCRSSNRSKSSRSHNGSPSRSPSPSRARAAAACGNAPPPRRCSG